MADSDRNLLIGILAVQLDFVGKDDLIRAMNQWVLQKDVPFEEILVEQGFLDESGKQLLVALVEKHLEQHGRQPAQSLAAPGRRCRRASGICGCGIYWSASWTSAKP